MTKIGIKNKRNEQKTGKNSVDSNPTVSINILNVKSINTPVKRQTLTEWMKEQDSALWCLQESHFKYKDTHKFRDKQAKHEGFFFNNRLYFFRKVLAQQSKEGGTEASYISSPPIHASVSSVQSLSRV